MNDNARRFAFLMGAALAAIVLLFLLYDPHRAPDGVVLLDRAERAEFATHEGEHLVAMEDVRLPQNWRTDIPLPGRPPTGIVEGRYQIDLAMPQQPAEPLYLLIPRVAQTVSVWLNGEEVFDQSDLDPDTRWQWYEPTLVPIPAGAVGAGNNRLEISVLGTFYSTAGLSRLFLGDREAVAGMKERLHFLQTTLPHYTNIVTIIMALPLFLIWLHGRHVEGGPFAGYGLLALATTAFGLRSMHVHAGEALLPMSLWLPLVSASLGWAVGVFCLFLMRFLKLNRPWFEWGLGAFILLGTAIQFAFPESLFMQMRTLLWYVPVAAIGIACIVTFCIATVLAPDRDRIVISISILLLIPTAIHDLLWVRGVLAFESVMWLPLTMPAVLLAISATVANRFARAWVAADAANRMLKQRVAAAENRIRSFFEARLDAERREAVASERALLIEDLHDGVGSRLSMLLATLQTASLPREQNVQSLRECLEDLRMIMTARDTGDLGEALAELCALQAGMLEASGLTLDLERGAKDDDVRLGPKRTLNVLRIVQEAVSNAVRHGGGDTITVSYAVSPDGAVDIGIRDGGVARAPADAPVSSSGRGLATMSARAQRLGGRLEVDRAAHGWTVSLSLPADRQGARSGPQRGDGSAQQEFETATAAQ